MRDVVRANALSKAIAYVIITVFFLGTIIGCVLYAHLVVVTFPILVIANIIAIIVWKYIGYKYEALDNILGSFVVLSVFYVQYIMMLGG